MGTFNAKDYLVRAKEREESGKTSEEIVAEREYENRKSSSSSKSTSSKVQATPAAAKAIQDAYKAGDPEAIRITEKGYTPTIEGLKQQTVFMTPAAQAVIERASPEQYNDIIRPGVNYYTAGPGAQIAPSTKVTREVEKERFIAEQLDRRQVLSSQIKRQYREQGYVDERGRAMPVRKEDLEGAERLDEINRARVRKASRDYQAGKITKTQFNRTARSVNLDTKKYNQTQEREYTRQQKLQRRAQDTQPGIDFINQQQIQRSPQQSSLPTPGSIPKDKLSFGQAWGNFNSGMAYKDMKTLQGMEQWHGKKSENVQDLATIFSQANPISIGKNFITRGKLFVNYEQSNVVEKAGSDFFSGFLGAGTNLGYTAAKGAVMSHMIGHSMLADPLGTTKSSAKAMREPFPVFMGGSKEDRYQQGRDAFKPITIRDGFKINPKGVATWMHVGLGTYMGGKALQMRRAAPPKEPKGFTQETEVVFAQSKSKHTLTPGRGKSQPLTDIALFRKDQHSLIQSGVSKKSSMNPIGEIRFGTQGKYARYDYINLQNKQTSSLILQKNILGGSKSSVVTTRPSVGGKTQIAVQTGRIRSLLGTSFKYKPSVTTKALPPILTTQADKSSVTTKNHYIFDNKKPQMFQTLTEHNYQQLKQHYNKNFWTRKEITTTQKTTSSQISQTDFTLQIISSRTTVTKNVLGQISQKTFFGDLKGQYPKPELGKLTPIQDLTTLTGHKKYTILTDKGPTSISLRTKTSVQSPRVISKIQSSLDVRGMVRFTSKSRIPEYFGNVKSKAGLFLRSEKGSLMFGQNRQVFAQPTITVPALSTQLTGSSSYLGGSSISRSLLSIPKGIPAFGFPQTITKQKQKVQIIPTQASKSADINIFSQMLSQSQASKPIRIQVSSLDMQPIQKVNPVQKMDLFQRVSPIQKIGTTQRQRQITRPVSIQQSAFVSLPMLGNSFSSFTPPTPHQPPPPPPIGGGFWWPGGSGGSARQSGHKSKKKGRRGYAPSLFAIDFNIKAPKGFNPNTFIGTGFGIRPLI